MFVDLALLEMGVVVVFVAFAFGGFELWIVAPTLVTSLLGFVLAAPTERRLRALDVSLAAEGCGRSLIEALRQAPAWHE